MRQLLLRPFCADQIDLLREICSILDALETIEKQLCPPMRRGIAWGICPPRITYPQKQNGRVQIGSTYYKLVTNGAHWEGTCPPHVAHADTSTAVFLPLKAIMVSRAASCLL